MGTAFTLVLLLATALVGWRYGLRLQRRGLDVETALSGPRGLWLLGLMIACSAGLLLLNKQMDALSPDLSSFLNHSGWGFTKAFLGFLGTMSVPLSLQRSPLHRFGLVLLALLGLGLVQRAEATVFAPIYPAIREDRRTEDGFVLQTQGTSCTAASLANLLSRYGVHSTEYACAKAMGTTRLGSTFGDMVRGMRHFGFEAREIPADPEHLQALDRPAILSVWSHDVRHSVVWTGQRPDGTQSIIDPLLGRQEVPGPALWQTLSSPKAVVLSVPPPRGGPRK